MFTDSDPLVSSNFAFVAAQCINRMFTTSGGRRTLWCHKGLWYRYENGRWNRWTEEDLARYLLRELPRARVVSRDGSIASLKVSRAFVGEIVAFLDANLQLEGELPRWRRTGPDAGYCIHFLGHVVNVSNGDLDLLEGTPDWIDPVQLRVPYDDRIVAPVWSAAIEQWSNGNPEWVSLLQEWMGYCLLPTTRYARWMMMKGPVRCGKGTITKVLQMLLGDDNCVNYSLRDFTDSFGLDGVQGSRVLVVNEVSDLKNTEGEIATQILKSIIGEDPVRVNRKYQRAQMNVRLSVKPILVTNQTVRLPNKGRGLSSKMLILPFTHSFLGHENEHLIDSLRDELDSIAAWCVEGARRIVRNRGRFTILEEAEEERREYLLENNPWDQFLEARFLPNPRGFVTHDMIWREFVSWKRSTGSNLSATRNRISARILDEGSWALHRCRPANDAPRGLRGLSLRNNPADMP